MTENLDPKMLDKRVHDRYMTRGQMDRRLFEKHLKALPDSADKAEAMELGSSIVEEDAPEDSTHEESTHLS